MYTRECTIIDLKIPAECYDFLVRKIKDLMFPTNILQIIGPRPQGVWMGLLTSVGSLAR
jgi:hypothetical protein